MNLLASFGWQPILIAATTAVAVAVLGALSTEIGPWYYSLRLPSWKPPDWAFGPIWTVIFTLAAASAVVAWSHAGDNYERYLVITLFAVNCVLNVLWSVLFFRLQRPDWALIEVMLLWLSIVVMIFKLARISLPASALLVPYLVWVSIASALNFTIVQMN